MKKIFKIIFIIVFVLVFFNVKAEEKKTFEMFVNQVKSLNEISEIATFFGIDEINITSEENKMIIKHVTSEGDYNLEYNYDSESDILSYNFDTTDSVGIKMLETVWFGLILDAAAKLNDYTDEQIEVWGENNEDSTKLTLENDGVELKVKSETEDKVTYENFKIKLNGIKLNIPTYPAPVITTSEITENSVKISVNVDMEDAEQRMCNVYESTDGINYKYILGVNCDGTVTYTLDELTPETTYYYKARVKGGLNYSEIKNINTLTSSNKEEPSKENPSEEEKNVQKDENEKKNPETSSSTFSIIGLIIMGILGISIIKYAKSKNVF